jgi:hypothetical protein
MECGSFQASGVLGCGVKGHQQQQECGEGDAAASAAAPAVQTGTVGSTAAEFVSKLAM